MSRLAPLMLEDDALMSRRRRTTMDHTDPAEALAAALAATQPAPEPADATAPGHDAGAVVAERRRLAALIEAAQATAPEDTQVRFDAHGFPHRDGQPVAWSDIR